MKSKYHWSGSRIDKAGGSLSHTPLWAMGDPVTCPDNLVYFVAPLWIPCGVSDISIYIAQWAEVKQCVLDVEGSYKQFLTWRDTFKCLARKDMNLCEMIAVANFAKQTVKCSLILYWVSSLLRCCMMMGTVGVAVFSFSVACLSLSVSLDCMQSWIHWLYSAAILVTQLTTPYIRIAPAAGDNQLTGQTCSSLLILWPQLFTYYGFNVLMQCWWFHSTGKQTSGILHVCGFVYCPAICIESVWLNQRLADIVSYLHLLSITGHERPVWGAIVIRCVSVGDFWQELIPFHE